MRPSYAVIGPLLFMFSLRVCDSAPPAHAQALDEPPEDCWCPQPPECPPEGFILVPLPEPAPPAAMRAAPPPVAAPAPVLIEPPLREEVVEQGIEYIQQARAAVKKAKVAEAEAEEAEAEAGKAE